MSTWYIQNGVLCHHGIQGQKWGVRNAEWYPIAAWKASLDAKFTKYKNKKKMAKVRAAKEEKARKQAEELEQARKQEEEKKRQQSERDEILSTASAKEILKANQKYKFTSEEIAKVKQRFDNEQQLKQLAAKSAKDKVQAISDKIGPIVSAMQLFNTVVGTGLSAKRNIDAIKKILNDIEKKKKECQNDTIKHHGVEGQKWGVRNGPPYPLQRYGNGQSKK